MIGVIAMIAMIFMIAAVRLAEVGKIAVWLKGDGLCLVLR